LRPRLFLSFDLVPTTENNTPEAKRDSTNAEQKRRTCPRAVTPPSIKLDCFYFRPDLFSAGRVSRG
jgi:hypothetical protein